MEKLDVDFSVCIYETRERGITILKELCQQGFCEKLKTVFPRDEIDIKCASELLKMTKITEITHCYRYIKPEEKNKELQFLKEFSHLQKITELLCFSFTVHNKYFRLCNASPRKWT